MREPSDHGTRRRPRWTRVTLPRGKGLIALAVCACAVVAGAVVAATASGGPAARVTGAGASRAAPSVRPAQPGAGASGASASGAGASGRASTSYGTSEGIAKTALRWPSGLQASMQRWNAGPGGAALSAVTTQLANAMQAAGVRLYPEARQGCAALRASIQTAQAAPPIPYPAMQNPYQVVLARLSSAAEDCRNAISVRAEGDESLDITLNKALLTHSFSELTAGSQALYTATARLRALHT